MSNHHPGLPDSSQQQLLIVVNLHNKTRDSHWEQRCSSSQDCQQVEIELVQNITSVPVQIIVCKSSFVVVLYKCDMVTSNRETPVSCNV